ncbi:MAG TPA: TonB-dependent receptor [Gemmatimonadaceae bacterium]|nr:TonB-dependent receptor [Gemmatimonadaceae bacterium]
MSGSSVRRAGRLGAWLLALAAPTVLLAQQPTAVVRGTVTEQSSNAPVVAANVAVKNGSARTQTDERGEFTLRVGSLNDTLVVSRIGFQQVEVPLAGRSAVTVVMTRTAVQLSEMVVVGYGTQRREDVTGSIASVDSTRLQDKPNTSVVQALQGATAGVTVTTSSSGAEPTIDVLIRGRNSITASTDPLVVVDGIPYDGPLSEINPNDIASLDVLKDASAAAIYGSRGSNGVILVTTKRGTPGKPRMSYDGYVGTSEIVNLPRMMNGQEFAAVKCQHINDGVTCTPDQIPEALTPSEQEVLAATGGTDWLGLATRTGHQQQHTLSVSGGDENTRYYLGGSLLDVSGVALNDDFDRYTLRLNMTQQIRPWLSLGTNTQFARTDRSGLRADFSDAFFMNPLTRPYNDDGTLTIYPWPEDIFWNNPLQGLDAVDRDINDRVFTSNYLEVDLPFVEGLSYRLNGGLDNARGESRRYYGRTTQIGSEVQGRAILDDDRRFDWTVENILRYTHDFGRSDLDVTALFSSQSSTVENDGLTAQGFPNDVLTYYQANTAALLEPEASQTRRRMLSQMARVNYSFDDRYLITGTVRRDGYSGFGANNKYGVFPSLALGWNASNEAWWPTGAVNSLKVRLSYGLSGNQAVSPYRTLSRLTDMPYVNGSNSAPGYRPSTLGNPNLKWETSRNLNLGFDFGVLDGRLRGTLDLYQTRTSDLLLARAISPVHGITSITQNIGAVKNRGAELQLIGRVLDRGDLTWDADFNIAMNRNEIVDLYGNGEDDVLNEWFIGQPIEVNYGYVFDGIWQEGDDIAGSAQPDATPGDIRYRDLNGDGKISADSDRTFIGSLEPSYTAGLTNTLRWRQFQLSALLTTVQGVTRSNSMLATNQLFPEVRRTGVVREYWTPEHPIDTYPANREGVNPLAMPIYQDASYVRLRDVTLSYNLDPSLSSRLGVSSARVYVSGRNLATWTDWIGLDPELGEQRAVPQSRTLIGGVAFAF